MFRSLRYKFIISFVSIEILFISLIVFFNFSALDKLSQSLIDEKITTSTLLFEEMVRTPLVVYDLATLDDQTLSFTKMKNIVSVKILDTKNRILSQSISKNASTFSLISKPFFQIEKNGHTYKIVNVVLDYKHEPVGYAQIVYEITDSLKEIENNRRLTYFLIGIEILISTLVVFFVGWKLTKDLTQLTEIAKQIALNEESEFGEMKGKNHEIQVLFDSFKMMQSKILERKKGMIEEKNFIHTIVDNANAIIAVIRADGTMIRLNEYGQNFVGYTEEEVGAEPFFWVRFLNPNIQDKVIGIIEKAKQGEIVKTYQNTWISREGEERVFEWSNALVNKEDGSLDYIFTIGIDITETELIKKEFQTIFETAKDGLAILDMQSNFLEFNDAYLEMTGFTREELLSKSCIELTIPEDISRSMEALATVKEIGFLKNFEKTCQVKDNKKLTINMALTLLPDKERILIISKDISAKKEYENHLEHIAHYDALTGLPNRILNADRLRQAILQANRRDEQIAVLFLDLDGFKEINDMYGHAIGDEFLKTLSIKMKEVLREEDTISRMGGDEFVAILGGLNDTSDAILIIQRLLGTAGNTIQLGDISVQASASIGVTFYPQFEDVDADQLIRQADQAMYEAKQSGKNRFYIFDPEHDRTIRSHHKNIDRIQQALNNNEFELYYQPKINLRTGELLGSEALIRWIHPEKGLIPPLDFLPIIEDHSLVIDVGEWVIHEALNQIQRWKNEGLEISVSVNVGARQLLREDFVSRLKAIIQEHPNVDSSKLEIEILETSALEDISLASDIIQECKTIGIDFSLDDFGTGYSSLSYLKRLPVTSIKIDQTFVRDILTDYSDLAIVEGVINLASAFERKVIAEGIETKEVEQKLISLGCEFGQGFSIAHPMPAKQMSQWAKNRGYLV